ncbi:ricin-type beta-trefoil lectin domain protein [Kitasatospora sp. NPDC090091]|uniref:ricin-type beta-trefoil lectin domain protein n=1 Tax=Kitasatospora sp. NPDC090091 TaxID=3364081 RepID=UPI0037FB04CD
MLDAIAKAKSSGKPVVVDRLTGEASKTVANPDGTLTTTDNAQPVRAKRDGGWADIDSALRGNSDGTLSPAVATTGLVFSGGGSGPMATISTSDGKKLSISAPFALPKPSVSGPTATYTNVLPSVDLELTALPVGGWRDVIVVHTPEAAANPALKTLRFPLTAVGLTVASDASGRIDVKDEAGTLRFSSPAPLQWDSSKAAPSAPAAAPKSAQKAAFAAAAADAPAQAGGTPSTTAEPGDGATVARIGTKVSGGAIELTPDQGALGSGTGPWFLDPSLVAATSSVQGSVEVQENYPTAENYNKKTDLATGYCGYHSPDPSLDCGKLGRQRAYFQFGIHPGLYTTPGGAESPPTIFTSTLNAQVTSASSPGTATPFAVWSAPRPIHEHTDWDDQPCGKSVTVVMENCPKVNGQQLTGTGPLSIDVTDMMKQAVAGQWPWWTVGIAPEGNEKEMLYRHRIANNPSITTTYDITPTVWYPRTNPSPGFAWNNSTAECTSGGARPWDNPGWISSNQTIYLTANSYSPTGFNLYTSYQMWDDNDSNFHIEQGHWGGPYNDPALSLEVGSLSDGHQYGWLARSYDGNLTSPMSNWCYFRVDRTNPRVSISSTDFPPSGTPNPNPAKYRNDWGTFWINAEDPAPGSGLQASGIACVRVSTDPTPVVGWRCGQGDTYAPGQPYNFQPRQWGTNTLYAWAMDNAGNYSQPAFYNFYVPWKPGTQPLFGDVDNDQKPDIVITDAKGDLRIIGGTSDPAASLAPAAAAPGTDSTHKPTWADYQLTHRGTLNSGQAVDQIIAHNTKDADLRKKLYVLTSDQAGHFDSLRAGSITRPGDCEIVDTGATCPGYNAQDWSDVSQVIAMGTPEGEALKTVNQTTVTNTRTSLLTVENGQLYLYPHGTTDDVTPTAALIPTIAGTGSWSDYELLNPGPANGLTTVSATETRKQATIWARHRTNGNVYAYPITWKNGAPDYTSLTRPDAGTPILTGANWTTAAQPRVGAADLNNDGAPDLWAINAGNAITVFPGKSSTGTEFHVDGFQPWQFLGYADASTSIHPNMVSWQCMDAIGGPHNGAEIGIYNCWDTAAQRFNLAADGTIRAGIYCVSAKDDVLGNGSGVVLALCEGKSGQKWAVRPDGRIYLPATADATNNPSGKCLELPGWSTAQGTRLDIWDCPTLQDNQRWTLNPERTS